MPDPPQRNSHRRYLSVEMLARLGQVTGRRFDLERLHQVLGKTTGRADGDPLAHLAIASRELGLMLTPARMPLSEAVWHAHLDTPVVFWSDIEQRYLIVSYAGIFVVRLALYDDPEGGAVTISRAKLAARLGLADVSHPVEMGIIHPLSPAEGASTGSDPFAEQTTVRHGTRGNRNSRQERPHPVDAHADLHGMPPLSRFLRILRPERRDILLLLGFAVFSGLLYLALPFAVDTVVTNLAFGAQSEPYVQALLAVAKILALCLFLQAIIIGFQYYVAELIQRRIFIRTAGDLAYRLPRVKARALDAVHGPELVNRFLDVVTVQKNTAFFLLEGINAIAASLIGVLLLALYHPLLLVFVAVLVMLTVGGTWLLGRGAVNTAIIESRSKYDLVAWFEEIAAYPFLFKGPGGHELAHQRTNMLATQFIDARIRHFGIVFRQITGLLVLSVVASVALLLLGTWLVLSQQITLGQLVASELIMSGIVVALIKLGKKLEAWYDTMAATEKLGHLLDLETEAETGETPGRARNTGGMIVEARDMGFHYDAGPPLFEHRNLSIAAGERIALYGPQGSGVSSLLDLLFGVRQPTSGHISFDNLDSRDWNLVSLRESVQLLRRDEFIDGTLIENLRLGRTDIALEEIRNALDCVGLLDECLNHPDGLNLRLRVGGGPLSTSQRISLLIARALVQKPRLLLIDELFDGLDQSTFQRLSRLVLGRSRAWTVVVATRMQEVLAICDRTVELAPARLPLPAPPTPEQPAPLEPLPTG